MEIKKASGNFERNTTTHHRDLNEQEAIRTLESLTLNPNAVDKKYINIGNLYSHSVTGKQPIIINNEHAVVEHLEIYDNKGFYKTKLSDKNTKGLFFTLGDNFYENNSAIEERIDNLIVEGLLPNDKKYRNVYKNFGILGMGEFNEKGDMLGVKFTLALKNDAGIAEPFSEVFTSGVGRSTGHKIITNGTLRGNKKIVTPTTRGTTIVDASSAESAKMITDGLKTLILSKNNLIEKYINGDNLEKEFYQFTMNNVLEPIHDFNGVFSESIVKYNSHLLDSDFKDEKIIGSRRTINKNYYDNVFGKTNIPEFNVNDSMHFFQEKTFSEHKAKIIEKIFKNNFLPETNKQIISNDSPIFKFLKRTNLIYDTGKMYDKKRKIYDFTNEEAYKTAKEFENKVIENLNKKLDNAIGGAEFNRANFKEIQTNIKKELQSFDIQNQFIDYVTEKNKEVKINISTLQELSKNEHGKKINEVSKTIGEHNVLEPKFNVDLLYNEDSFNLQGLSMYEKSYVRKMMFDNGIISGNAAPMTFRINDEALELTIPNVSYDKATKEYANFPVTIKTNTDIPNFKVQYGIQEYATNSTMSENAARTINEVNAKRRLVELNIREKTILGDNVTEYRKNISTRVGATANINEYLALYNGQDIVKFNPLNSQTKSMAGEATYGKSYSGSNQAGTSYSDHRQPSAQSQNAMYEQEYHGTVISENLINNMEMPNNLEDRTLVKNAPYVTEQQLKNDVETSKKFGGKKRRNDINGYSLYLTDNSTWQENAVITNELKNVAKFSEEQHLSIRFNQINDKFYAIDEIKKLGITKENISSKFGESREQANKIIKLLMVEEFATKTSKQMDFVNKTQEEINTAVKKYNDKPHEYLMKKEKSGKATLLNKEYLHSSATLGVKVDYGLSMKNYEYDDTSIKLILDKVKIPDEGGKISFNGSKATISTVYDSISAHGLGKTFKAIGAYNAKSENRKQAGLELYNIFRTAVYNLSETNKESLKEFLNDPLIKQFQNTFSMKATDNQTIDEVVYNYVGEKYKTEYNKMSEYLFDYQNGNNEIGGVSQNFQKNLKGIAEKITGNKEAKIDVAELGAALISKYNEYGGENITPILIKDAVVEYIRNGIKILSKPQNVYRFLTTIHRNKVTETKAIENAVNFSEDSLRLLKEKGQGLLAKTIEDLIYEQAVNREGLEMEKLWSLTDYHGEDKEDFLKYLASQSDNEIINYNLSTVDKKEINALTSNEYMKVKDFNNTTVGKLIEEKGLSDGENLERNVVSILRSDKLDNFAKKLKDVEYDESKTYKKFRWTVNQILLDDGMNEREKKEAIIKLVRSDMDLITKNEFNKKISNFTKRTEYSTELSYTSVYSNQLSDLKDGRLVGLSNMSELAIDKRNTIVSNDALNQIKRWARAEKEFENLDTESIVKKIESIKLSGSFSSLTELQKVLNQPITAINAALNLIDTSSFENFRKTDGSMYKNISTVRIKNSFMAAPANNDYVFDSFTKLIDNPNFKSHMDDFFGTEISGKLNKFERIKAGNGISELEAIEKTKANFMKNLKELNDIAIVKDTIIPEHYNLSNSFEKTATGISRTFGKYVGYPLQTVANLSSSLLIMVNNNSDNIFAKVMMKSGVLESKKNKQIFFLNKKTWFKALRDFDGDKAQYMFNVLKDYESNKEITDTFILRDKYETFVKNGIEIDKDTLSKLNITKEQHQVDLTNNAFRERWYDAKLRKEIGKHDNYTTKVITHFLDKSVNENISVSEAITNTLDSFNRKYDFKKEVFISSVTDEEKEIFEAMIKSRRFKLNRDNPLHSTENIKSMIKTLTGIKDTGVIHSGVTQFRRLSGNIVFNELNEKYFVDNPESLKRINAIKESINLNMSEFSETAGMLIEDGAISAKHGQNAIVPSLIETFENIIHTRKKSPEAILSQEKQTNVLRNLTQSKTVEEYDKIYNGLSTKNQMVMTEISDFINSSMGAGFDISKNEYEHKIITSKIFSEINEVGNFLNEISQVKGDKFFGTKKADTLFKMDIANNLFSKTSGIANDSQLFETIQNISSERPNFFKPRYLDNFFISAKKSFEEKVNNYKSDKFLSKLEKENNYDINSLANDEFNINMKMLMKHVSRDIIEPEGIINAKEIMANLDLSQHNPEAGIKALKGFLSMMKADGLVMEGSYVASHEKTLNITERTFVALKKMIK